MLKLESWPTYFGFWLAYAALHDKSERDQFHEVVLHGETLVFSPLRPLQAVAEVESSSTFRETCLATEVQKSFTQPTMLHSAMPAETCFAAPLHTIYSAWLSHFLRHWHSHFPQNLWFSKVRMEHINHFLRTSELFRMSSEKFGCHIS